jgi:two-component system OmpR family sensor kinase
MKIRYLGILIAAALVLAGFGIGVLAERHIIPNVLLLYSITMDVSGLSSRVGMVLGILTLGGTVAAWRTVEYMRQAREEERRAQIDARRRFLQRLDHELKNPVTIIRLGLVNLRQSAELTGEPVHSLDRIDQQVHRLQRLVEDLRMLSDLEKRELEGKPINLKDVLEEAILQAGAAVEGKRSIGLSLQQTPWPVSAVWGDRDLLVLAFRNLLDNALKFTQPEERVEVRITEDGKTAIVEVADSGPGIPEDEIPHIFEDLYRGRNSRGIPGSGLGLRLVEGILTLHKGTIGVRSRSGKGTVFTVRLPLTAEG